jgi:hypothetical protein
MVGLRPFQIQVSQLGECASRHLPLIEILPLRNLHLALLQHNGGQVFIRADALAMAVDVVVNPVDPLKGVWRNIFVTCASLTYYDSPCTLALACDGCAGLCCNDLEYLPDEAHAKYPLLQVFHRPACVIPLPHEATASDPHLTPCQSGGQPTC